MSISESLSYGQTVNERGSTNRAEPTTILDQLAEALSGLFLVQTTQQDRGQRGRVIVFQGKMVVDPQTAFPLLTERFAALGFTAKIAHHRGKDEVAAVEGFVRARSFSSSVWLHGTLLGLTVLTTAISGAAFTGRSLDVILRELARGNIRYLWTAFQYGAPFALTLLLILGVHEMGHYIAARRHKIAATLPYFIPLPILSLLGTLGAVIFIKGEVTNRKALFDVGVSGPLAGFIVALIAFLISFSLPVNTVPNLVFRDAFRSEQLGMPLILRGVYDVLDPVNVPNLGIFVSRQPVALAAWFGMFLTALNLIPIGQLDGGHIMYALFGRLAWAIALIGEGVLIIVGLLYFPSFLIYAVLALLTGLRHPPPNDDLTPLGWPRRILGYATIVLFFLVLTVNPFQIRLR